MKICLPRYSTRLKRVLAVPRYMSDHTDKTIIKKPPIKADDENVKVQKATKPVENTQAQEFIGKSKILEQKRKLLQKQTAPAKYDDDFGEMPAYAVKKEKTQAKKSSDVPPDDHLDLEQIKNRLFKPGKHGQLEPTNLKTTAQVEEQEEENITKDSKEKKKVESETKKKSKSKSREAGLSELNPFTKEFMLETNKEIAEWKAKLLAAMRGGFQGSPKPEDAKQQQDDQEKSTQEKDSTSKSSESKKPENAFNAEHTQEETQNLVSESQSKETQSPPQHAESETQAQIKKQVDPERSIQEVDAPTEANESEKQEDTLKGEFTQEETQNSNAETKSQKTQSSMQHSEPKVAAETKAQPELKEKDVPEENIQEVDGATKATESKKQEDSLKLEFTQAETRSPFAENRSQKPESPLKHLVEMVAAEVKTHNDLKKQEKPKKQFGSKKQDESNAREESKKHDASEKHEESKKHEESQKHDESNKQGESKKLEESKKYEDSQKHEASKKQGESKKREESKKLEESTKHEESKAQKESKKHEESKSHEAEIQEKPSDIISQDQVVSIFKSGNAELKPKESEPKTNEVVSKSETSQKKIEMETKSLDAKSQQIASEKQPESKKPEANVKAELPTATSQSNKQPVAAKSKTSETTVQPKVTNQKAELKQKEAEPRKLENDSESSVETQTDLSKNSTMPSDFDENEYQLARFSEIFGAAKPKKQKQIEEIKPIFSKPTKVAEKDKQAQFKGKGKSADTPNLLNPSKLNDAEQKNQADGTKAPPPTGQKSHQVDIKRKFSNPNKQLKPEVDELEKKKKDFYAESSKLNNKVLYLEATYSKANKLNSDSTKQPKAESIVLQNKETQSNFVEPKQKQSKKHDKAKAGRETESEKKPMISEANNQAAESTKQSDIKSVGKIETGSEETTPTSTESTKVIEIVHKGTPAISSPKGSNAIEIKKLNETSKVEPGSMLTRSELVQTTIEEVDSGSAPAKLMKSAQDDLKQSSESAMLQKLDVNEAVTQGKNITKTEVESFWKSKAKKKPEAAVEPPAVSKTIKDADLTLLEKSKSLVISINNFWSFLTSSREQREASKTDVPKTEDSQKTKKD